MPAPFLGTAGAVNNVALPAQLQCVVMSMVSVDHKLLQNFLCEIFIFLKFSVRPHLPKHGGRSPAVSGPPLEESTGLRAGTLKRMRASTLPLGRRLRVHVRDELKTPLYGPPLG